VPADLPGLAPADGGALRRAREAQLAAARAGGAGNGMGLLAVALAIGATAATFGGAIGGAIVAAALAVTLAALALSQRARAAALARTSRAEADAAAMRVAEAVLRARGSELTAGDLGRVMRVDASDAERLLTALAAGDRVRVDVADDAELRWSTATPPVLAEAGADAEAPSATKRAGSLE